MMEGGSSSAEEGGYRGVKQTLGVILLGAGLSLCLWIFLQAVALLEGEKVALVDRLIPVSRASRSILAEGQQVELPVTFFEFGAYGMAVGILSLLATMANALIRGGAALLQPGLGRQLARLENEVREALRPKSG